MLTSALRLMGTDFPQVVLTKDRSAENLITLGSSQARTFASISIWGRSQCKDNILRLGLAFGSQFVEQDGMHLK